MTEQEALEWFRFRNERYTISDKCQQAEEVAIKALEKQIPKKPIDKGILHKDFRCPVCHCEVEIANTQLGYCEYCGQKLNWD